MSPRTVENHVGEGTRGLRLSEEHFRVFIEDVQEYAFILLDTDGKVRAWNSGAERLLGYTEAEILGQSASVFFTPEDIARKAPEEEMQTAQREGRAEDERWHVRKDGSRFFANGMLTVLRESTFLGYAKVMRDFTERRRAEEALRSSEERFRLLVENVRDHALFQTDLNGNITSWNPGAERVFGYSGSEILGRSLQWLATPEDASSGALLDELRRTRMQDHTEDARWLIRKDGDRIWCRWVTSAVFGDGHLVQGFVKVLRDETERRNAEEQIKASLREKEAMLQEIHHRVKNNLQLAISLLNLQGSYVDDERVRAMFDEMSNRLYSIADIHELLYGSFDLAQVDFGAYVTRLGGQLLNFYMVDRDRVSLSIRAQDFFLPISQAVPCGLVINELVVNALKYAFPDGRCGAITVELQRTTESYEVRVSDDGIGLPSGLAWEEANSMGLRLIRVLALQLEGTVEKQIHPSGTSFLIRFPRTRSTWEAE